MTEPSFEIGSLVRARGREWVVLPESDPATQMWVLRPLGGTDDEVTGIYGPLEDVSSAEIQVPDPGRDLGDHRSARLLREAVRLGFRAGTGPFRSLGHIAVEPRPYQIVPLLMALRLDPIRLLIADDVGIGKTIEACLIARELLDRGEIARFTVLCPPHLAEQWQRALVEQFHIDAELVLRGTAARLEKGLAPGQSLFDRHPFTVVSLDWIKTERRRYEFLRACPELVIVDEAHTCASNLGLGRSAQRRHALLKSLVADDPTRHLLLVTATPHSGDESSFRSLLALLDPSLSDLPEELSGEENRPHRERLARHLVQRRRADLADFLEVHTPFPHRETAEVAYRLSPSHRAYFDRSLAWWRKRLKGTAGDTWRDRVRWWSALAFFRSLSSSPAAAAATLRNRAAGAESESLEETEALGLRAVMDLEDEDQSGSDAAPGSQESEEGTDPDRRRMLEDALAVEKLAGAEDLKFTAGVELVKKLLADGFAPILFCRFIPTVEYVAAGLRKALGKLAYVEEVTGALAPEEREMRVARAGGQARRVLVCTDCLSEGINLQGAFDAVVHYDLSWNPTRHEQREGRVDRYGQPRRAVRAITLFGQDNEVDGAILRVLLRKHQAIRQSLGINVPLPADSHAVMEAVMKSLLMVPRAVEQQLAFTFAVPQEQEIALAWQKAADREKKSRTLFAQRSIKVEDVAEELDATRTALGDAASVEAFIGEALPALGGTFSPGDPARLSLEGAPVALRDLVDVEGIVSVCFASPAPDGVRVLRRTDPLVAGLAGYVLEAALDPLQRSPARRISVIQTRSVSRRTTLILLRLRFHLVVPSRGGGERALLAEEALMVGFSGPPTAPEWLNAEKVTALLVAEPSANMADEIKRGHAHRILAGVPALLPALAEKARERAESLLSAHRRVRRASRQQVRALRVDPHLPPDLLGIFVYMPDLGGS